MILRAGRIIIRRCLPRPRGRVVMTPPMWAFIAYSIRLMGKTLARLWKARSTSLVATPLMSALRLIYMFRLDSIPRVVLWPRLGEACSRALACLIRCI